jgi:hypothetical protein
MLFHPAGGGAIAAAERRNRFGMGDIEAAASGHQEFTRRTRHAFKHGDGESGRGHRLGGHQAGRSAADYGDMRGGMLCGGAHAALHRIAPPQLHLPVWLKTPAKPE